MLTFSYNEFDQVVTANLDGSTLQNFGSYIQADSSDVGNLLQVGATTLSYPTGGLNVARPHVPTAFGSTTFSYDNNGNRSSVPTYTLHLHLQHREPPDDAEASEYHGHREQLRRGRGAAGADSEWDDDPLPRRLVRVQSHYEHTHRVLPIQRAADCHEAGRNAVVAASGSGRERRLDQRHQRERGSFAKISAVRLGSYADLCRALHDASNRPAVHGAVAGPG